MALTSVYSCSVRRCCPACLVGRLTVRQTIERQGPAINRLREFRVKADKSQIELSRETGVAQATISNIESGNRTPSYLTRQRLAKALDVAVEEIFPNDGNLAKRTRRTVEGRTFTNLADILLVNAEESLSTELHTKKTPEVTTYTIKGDNKVIGYLIGNSGQRLKIFPIRLFLGTDYLMVQCSDNTGKFVFEGLKKGEYSLSAEGKTLTFKIG